MGGLTKETKKEIQKEYNALKGFRNGELDKLATKHNITVEELLNIIDL